MQQQPYNQLLETQEDDQIQIQYVCRVVVFIIIVRARTAGSCLFGFVAMASGLK